MAPKYKVYDDRPQTHAEANVRYRNKRRNVLNAARDYVHAREAENPQMADEAWKSLRESVNALFPQRLTPPVRSPEFWAWSSMRARCNNEKDPSYDNYGGRGIYVCERWQNSFFAFFEDMGPRPTPGHSLDRINNNGPYSPENCQWATKQEQHNNRRVSRLYDFEGEMLNINQIGRRIGVPFQTIQARINRGLPPSRWFEPSRRKRETRPVVYKGKPMTMVEAAKASGIPAPVLSTRRKQGVPDEHLFAPIGKRGHRLSDRYEDAY